MSLRRVIDDAIRGLPDPESQLVLKYRYIDGLTIEEIASQMHYCERHISRLHESPAAIRLPDASTIHPNLICPSPDGQSDW